ncbi:methyltransferase domain-containing protein [Agrobacterium tumefaciens]|nr:methyltransferase domain-containing protein [Agrobacterium tumefaciens]
MLGLRCSLCGGFAFTQHSVLWPELVNEWQLLPHEAEYIERQQGMRCDSCGANLRGVALGCAISEILGVDVPLREYVKSGAAKNLCVLDMNGTSISTIFNILPGYIRADYPTVDMNDMPYEDQTFDLVVHSDTLEHVPVPGRALVECRRVLKPSGSLCYTVPIVVGRMTRSREGLPPSYHGKVTDKRNDYLVQTEFGADAWCLPVEAGFQSVKMTTLLYPAAIAITARR